MRGLAFSRDGKNLTFIGEDGVPEIWNVFTNEKVAPSGPDEFREARERGLSGIIALSADDAWLAAGEARGSVTVWDLPRRRLLLTLPEERGTNWGLAWSPDRKLLAGGFSDGSLVIWNIPRVRAQLAKIGLDWQD